MVEELARLGVTRPAEAEGFGRIAPAPACPRGRTPPRTQEADAEYVVAVPEELLQEGRQPVARPASLTGLAAAPAPLIEGPAPVVQEELAQARVPWPAGAGRVAILAHRRSAPAPARPRGWTPLRTQEESAHEVAVSATGFQEELARA